MKNINLISLFVLHTITNSVNEKLLNQSVFFQVYKTKDFYIHISQENIYIFKLKKKNEIKYKETKTKMCNLTKLVCKKSFLRKLVVIFIFIKCLLVFFCFIFLQVFFYYLFLLFFAKKSQQNQHKWRSSSSNYNEEDESFSDSRSNKSSLSNIEEPQDPLEKQNKNMDFYQVLEFLKNFFSFDPFDSILSIEEQIDIKGLINDVLNNIEEKDQEEICKEVTKRCFIADSFFCLLDEKHIIDYKYLHTTNNPLKEKNLSEKGFLLICNYLQFSIQDKIEKLTKENLVDFSIIDFIKCFPKISTIKNYYAAYEFTKNDDLCYKLHFCVFFKKKIVFSSAESNICSFINNFFYRILIEKNLIIKPLFKRELQQDYIHDYNISKEITKLENQIENLIFILGDTVFFGNETTHNTFTFLEQILEIKTEESKNKLQQFIDCFEKKRRQTNKHFFSQRDQLNRRTVEMDVEEIIDFMNELLHKKNSLFMNEFLFTEEQIKTFFKSWVHADNCNWCK